MTQPEETTAALIAEQLNESNQARDHWETAHDRMKASRDASFAATSKAQDERDRARVDLQASKAECLQWRKDIDEERRQVAFRDSMIANMTKQMDESDRDRVRVCNEQRARAEKAECALEAEIERCIAEKRQGDIYWNKIHEARKKLGETKPEREGGRSLALCVLDIKGLVDALDQDNRELRQRAEAAEHKVAMLEAEVQQLKRERDEALQSLGRVQADYQVLLLGTAHGVKCWMDECGWHCGEGCKAEHAKKCIAAWERDNARTESLHAGLVGREMAENLDAVSTECLKAQRLAKEAGADCERALKERDEAREQLAKLEWAGIGGWNREPQCGLCDGYRPGQPKAMYGKDNYGHKPGCWFAKKEAETVAPPDNDKSGRWAQVRWDKTGRAHRAVAGCDFAKAPAIPETFLYIYTGWPQPKPAEPARPEPRFKVGERVYHRIAGTGEVVRGDWVSDLHHPGGAWCYVFAAKDGLAWEEDLVPAPKFAVGEWVMLGVHPFEVKRRFWSPHLNRWGYGGDNNATFGEHELTAQAPQHKHDCKGCVCVFLGRYSNRRGGEWDLWYRDAPGRELGFDCGYGLQWWSVNARGGAMDQTIAEARRRAVARGLV